MRPDKPGSYWWEDVSGKPHVLEVFHDGSALSHAGDGYDNVFEFELHPIFEKWLGPAHPPKKVRRGIMEQGVFRDVKKGICVLYDDVEEFLIGVDDE